MNRLTPKVFYGLFLAMLVVACAQNTSSDQESEGASRDNTESILDEIDRLDALIRTTQTEINILSDDVANQEYRLENHQRMIREIEAETAEAEEFKPFRSASEKEQQLSELNEKWNSYKELEQSYVKQLQQSKDDLSAKTETLRTLNRDKQQLTDKLRQ